MRDFDSARAQWRSAWFSSSIFWQLKHSSQQSVATPLVLIGFWQFSVFASVRASVFQFFKLMAGEEVGVAEPSARERALQKLDALGLPGKLCEGHAVFQRVVAGAGGGNQIQAGNLNTSDFAVLLDDRQAGFARRRNVLKNENNSCLCRRCPQFNGQS